MLAPHILKFETYSTLEAYKFSFSNFIYFRGLQILILKFYLFFFKKVTYLPQDIFNKILLWNVNNHFNHVIIKYFFSKEKKCLLAPKKFPWIFIYIFFKCVISQLSVIVIMKKSNNFFFLDIFVFLSFLAIWKMRLKIFKVECKICEILKWIHLYRKETTNDLHEKSFSMTF